MCIRDRGYGWSFQEINGHNFKQISNAIKRANKSKKPSIISCKTVIGFGSPNKSGKAGSMGDIGTHAANMVEYVTGRKILKLLAKVNVFVEGRLLEDDGNVLISLEGNIEGNLMTSQIASGEENYLKI